MGGNIFHSKEGGTDLATWLFWHTGYQHWHTSWSGFSPTFFIVKWDFVTQKGRVGRFHKEKCGHPPTTPLNQKCIYIRTVNSITHFKSNRNIFGWGWILNHKWYTSRFVRIIMRSGSCISHVLHETNLWHHCTRNHKTDINWSCVLGLLNGLHGSD